MSEKQSYLVRAGEPWTAENPLSGLSWLSPAVAGCVCDNCNDDKAVILLDLSDHRLVHLCCRCLEEAASFAQP